MGTDKVVFVGEQPEVCSAHARPLVFSTKCNTVVQVPWLPEVT